MPKQQSKRKQYLTPNEVADLLMVSPITIRQWATKGDLPALTTPGGHRRFVWKEVERFARQKGVALRPMSGDLHRILIVDDDQQFASFLLEYFNVNYQDQVEMELANDGFEAGQKIETFHPDIVILDLMMPGLNGFDVCKRIKSEPRTKAIRVIAMTGYFTEESAKRIRQEGAETCLAKPLDMDNLNQLLGLELSAHTE